MLTVALVAIIYLLALTLVVNSGRRLLGMVGSAAAGTSFLSPRLRYSREFS